MILKEVFRHRAMRPGADGYGTSIVLSVADRSVGQDRRRAGVAADGVVLVNIEPVLDQMQERSEPVQLTSEGLVEGAFEAFAAVVESGASLGVGEAELTGNLADGAAASVETQRAGLGQGAPGVVAGPGQRGVTRRSRSRANGVSQLI